MLNNTIVYVLGQYNRKDVARATGCDCYIKNLKLMTLDTTNTSGSLILFLWNETNIWASDMDGCHCWNVIKVPLMSGEYSLLLIYLVVMKSLVFYGIQLIIDIHPYLCGASIVNSPGHVVTHSIANLGKTVKLPINLIYHLNPN